MEYTDRILVFLDILGFSQTIEESINDGDIRLNLFNALNQLHEYDSKSRDIKGRRVTTFSDSMVISII